MTAYYISQTATNGYSVGVDTNAGTSKDAPWLTLEKFVSVYAIGDTVTVNDGTYTHASGYWQFTKGCTIHPENVGLVTFKGHASMGASDQVFYLAPAASGYTYDLDGLIVDGNSAVGIGLFMGNRAGGYNVSINNFKAINCLGATSQGIIHSAATDAFILRGNNVTITGGGILGGFTARSLASGSIIELDGVTLALTGITVTNGSGIWLASPTTQANARVANVTGTTVHNATGASSIVKMENIPGIIEDCHDLVMTGTATSAAAFAIYPTAAIDCDTPVVRRNKRIHNNCVGQYTILFGTDSSTAYDNRIKTPISHDNDIRGNAGTAMHGILFGFCSGGISSHDEFSYVGLPFVMKGQTVAAYVVAGKSHHCTTGDSGAIYSKGSVGARYVSNLVDMRGHTGRAMTADVNGATVSSDCLYRGNMIIQDSDSAKVDFVGVGCSATFSWNNYILPGTVNATTAFVYDGVPAATLVAWGAAHETTYTVDQSQEANYRALHSASWMVGGIEGALIAQRGRL